MEIYMSKAKFTKGKWIVKGRSMAMGSNYRGDFSVKSDRFSGNISDASNANASLIAAAPDMYEMLQRWVDSVESVSDDYQLGILDETIELLAKARGEQ